MTYAIENIPIKKIKPANYNPRDINPEALKGLIESIRKFGMPQPLVINKKTNVLVSGHQRLTAAKALNFDTVPVVFVDLSEIEEKALNVTLNNQKISGHFTHALGSLLDEIRIELGADFFKDIKLDEIEIPPLPEEEAAQENERADSIPEVALNECGVKLGDIYQLGEHRLMCGDSTDLGQVKELMDGKLADLWIADPPFGVSYVEKNAAVHGGIVKNAIGKEIKSDTKTVEELKPFWKASAEAAYAVTTNKASNYWCACQGSDKMMMMMMMMMDEAGWNIRHELIWVKSSFVFGRSDYHYRHEPIIYGWKKKGNHEWHGDRKQSSVFQIDRPNKSDMHPTTKPVDLFSQFISNSTARGARVFESFGGSGTTLISCESLGRASNTMELDPHYCSVIIKRFEQFSGKKAIKL